MIGAPGRIPDGRVKTGTVLRIAKNPVTSTNLDLIWGASCNSSANDYAVYQGTIGAWYSHQTLDCSTVGAISDTVTPGAGSRYFIVVPLNGAYEGSYGVDSSLVERPPASGARCAANSNPACP